MPPALRDRLTGRSPDQWLVEVRVNDIITGMEFLISDWRLVCTGPAPGAWNMAVDEALLEAVGSGRSLPVLRLYAWSPACLSLGYAQPFADVDMERLLARGWQVVRRPTGGRAILHTDELTYAVIAPPDEPRVAGSVLESYSRLAQALLRALSLLELPARADESYGAGSAVKNANPICFEVPSNYEITAGGKKLIGSAQARRREGVLQHGALPLRGDLARIVQGLRFDSDEARRQAGERLLERAVTVGDVLGRPVSWQQAADAFRQAFEQVLALRFSEQPLSEAERLRADELAREKYAHPTWTERI
jgi:lipoate-protein ligase A